MCKFQQGVLIRTPGGFLTHGKSKRDRGERPLLCDVFFLPAQRAAQLQGVKPPSRAERQGCGPECGLYYKVPENNF